MSTALETTAREVALAWLTNDDATVNDLTEAIVRVAREHAERETESALTALSSARARAERSIGQALEAEGNAAGAISLLRRIVEEQPSERAMRMAQCDARDILKRIK